MNIAYRSIYNERLGAWVAVGETTAARGKKSSGGLKLAAVALAIAGAFGGSAALAVTVGSDDAGTAFAAQPAGSASSVNGIAIGVNAGDPLMANRNPLLGRVRGKVLLAGLTQLLAIIGGLASVVTITTV